MNELLWVFKRTWQVFSKLCKGIKAREREREREKSGTLYECILMQLSISNLFLELLYQVDVLSIFFLFFFFLAWQGLWRQVGERRCAIFLQPHNQQNITASLLWRDHLSLKGPKSRSSNNLWDFRNKSSEGTSRSHSVLYCILKMLAYSQHHICLI